MCELKGVSWSCDCIYKQFKLCEDALVDEVFHAGKWGEGCDNTKLYDKGCINMSRWPSVKACCSPDCCNGDLATLEQAFEDARTMALEEGLTAAERKKRQSTAKQKRREYTEAARRHAHHCAHLFGKGLWKLNSMRDMMAEPNVQFLPLRLAMDALSGGGIAARGRQNLADLEERSRDEEEWDIVDIPTLDQYYALIQWCEKEQKEFSERLKKENPSKIQRDYMTEKHRKPKVGMVGGNPEPEASLTGPSGAV